MTTATGTKLTSTKTRAHILTGRMDQTVMRTLYTGEDGNLYVRRVTADITGTGDKYELVKFAGMHCGWGRNGWYEFDVYSSYSGDWDSRENWNF